MKRWLRSLRPAPVIPDAAWQAVLARYPFLSERPASDVERLRQLSAQFLRDKRFHGAQGFVITDEVALAVATQAVLPVLHLPGDLDWYDDFVGVVVHKSEVVAPRQVMDEAGVVHEYDEVVAGEAMQHGPVMLSWQDVLASSVTQSDGYNVVIHEFAHKIDMRDGLADGCPPLPAGFGGTRGSRAAKAHWNETLSAAYTAFREKTIMAERFGAEAPWLDDYAAESTTEFFAVACEAYFVNRARFGEEFPTLLELFDQFFLGGG
ncbi:zinc-dependent peptidase [Variovorax dokdonensis]|uniref:Zinc-dependent peptidase n=1 Tax=Variovorax dokdonensis TaxID=344883 RepID=A0ABT7NDA1_9BURK|nr:M90 family metallopeptidase [Variovorax dokdonensis]MDM0045815.1 zinc-dependent peptidase [Variovorax dokdonensis]